AQSLDNLALLYWQQEKLAEAEPLHERALGIRERVLGPEHPDTASSLNHLGLLLLTRGKPAEVEPLFQRALAIREQELRPQHPHPADSLLGLHAVWGCSGPSACSRIASARWKSGSTSAGFPRV